METYREEESGRKREREREREGQDSEIPVYLIKLSPIARLNYAYDLISGCDRIKRRGAFYARMCGSVRRLFATNTKGTVVGRLPARADN